MNKQDYLKREEMKINQAEFEVFENSIKTSNIVLAVFLLIQERNELKIEVNPEYFIKNNFWNMFSTTIIKSGKSEGLIKKFYSKEAKIDPLVFGTTLVNIINEYLTKPLIKQEKCVR